MKTSELTGPALDWAVAKCESILDQDHQYPNGATCKVAFLDPMGGVLLMTTGDWFRPSTNWSQGGPIIEREGILPTITDVERSDNSSVSFSKTFRAKTPAQYLDHDEGMYGPTPLIAAMRCFVASKLGDDVDVPKALL